MTQDRILRELSDRAVAFDSISDLAPLIEMIKDKKVVMLGEASHGTKEFYDWRSRISRELVEKHGFHFIAVEGDWPPCQEVNRYVHFRNDLSAFETLSGFSRWPTWMWANDQMLGTVQWMREWNRFSDVPVSFHGLDVYSLYESLDEVVAILQSFDLDLAQTLKQYYACFDPYRHNEMAYVRSLVKLPEGCGAVVIKALQELLVLRERDREEIFDATQNASVVLNADRYYRTMVLSENDQSWNVRDQHMMDTLEVLLRRYGPEAKGIVWAHNTHIGDYRATDMLLHGQVNIGGLARERLGRKNVALIGFTTHRGSVIASRAWDGPIEIMDVPKAKEGSLEDLLQKTSRRMGCGELFLDFTKNPDPSALRDYLGHRAMGVVYWPELEGKGNYVPTSAAGRYDGMIFIEESCALTPLDLSFDRQKVPDTFPFGARL